MGKEIKREFEDKKSKIISASINKAVDTYLTRNVDRFGYAHVTSVNLSGDFKTAFIYICFEDKDESDNLFEKLSNSKREISNCIRSLINTRYFPKIILQKGEDENLDF